VPRSSHVIRSRSVATLIVRFFHTRLAPMVRVRFAPSPTGSLHLGNALSAVANRRFADEHGGTLLLRIDDTDQARNLEGGAAEIAADLEWLGVRWDEGPVHQSSRFVRHREAAHQIGEPDDEGALRFGRTTLLRPDGTPTYQLASAVDDVDFEITHVIRGSDHRANAELQAELIRALGAEPPEFIHHGLLLGEDGTKLAKRHGAATVADLRAAGIPAEAVRAYLDELGLPKHDVHLDLKRLRRLSVDALAALSDDELAARVGVDVSLAPVLRGARDLAEARDYAQIVLEPEHVDVDAAETMARFRELVEAGVEPRAIVRELKAVGGDLKSLRLALTGRDRGPELAAVIAALPRDELLRRSIG
jgi:tRNA synthetases class I (E and Q), catalytic domain